MGRLCQTPFPFGVSQKRPTNNLMKIAAAQISCAPGDLKANVRKIRDFSAQAKKSGTELIVFPEMVDTGYSMPAIQEHATSWNEGADRRRCAHPAEANRPAVENLVGENREQRGRTAEQDGEQVECDGRENHAPAEYESHSGDEAAPGVLLRAIPTACAAVNRQDEQEKRKSAEGVERVNERESRVRNEQTADTRTNHRGDLENAVVPSNSVRERVA